MREPKQLKIQFEYCVSAWSSQNVTSYKRSLNNDILIDSMTTSALLINSLFTTISQDE